MCRRRSQLVLEVAGDLRGKIAGELPLEQPEAEIDAPRDAAGRHECSVIHDPILDQGRTGLDEFLPAV